MVYLGKRTKIVLLGLVVHILLLIAAADIYFSSPLDHGMKSVRSGSDPPANRLVFIVADGLRAQAVYSDGGKIIPYLTKIRRNRGSWGIAHTRVPTESRPGHVAMLAGIYEDPSAVFKGWKMNPVEFDHVILQSKNAWCWGSPDIVSLFLRENMPHIHVYSYGSEMEDFGKRNTSALDAWVFTHVHNFLEIREQIRHINDTGNLFFLHLLGIDTAGHGFKPRSKEYIDNIKMVDKNLMQIERLFMEAFPDNKTVFLFTADHGMTDWGSHGSGSDDETQVPFIIWGAGIKQHAFPIDINQVDIAPLMASLIGVNIPINSLGVLPVEVLDLPRNKIAEMINANIFQLMEMFSVKINKIQSAIYPTPVKGFTYDYFAKEVVKLNHISLEKNFDIFNAYSREIMKQLVAGIDYYHNYFNAFILVALSIGFFTWLVYLASMTLSERHVKRVSAKISVFKIICCLLALFFLSIVAVYVLQLPYSYYAYMIFPLLMGYVIATEIQRLLATYIVLTSVPMGNFLTYALIGYATITLFLWGFKNHVWFSIAVPLQAGWMYISPSFQPFLMDSRFRIERYYWNTLNVCLAVFPMAPKSLASMKNLLFVIGAVIWFVLNYKLVMKMRIQYIRTVFQTTSLVVQLFIFACTFVWVGFIESGVIATDSNLKWLSWIFFLLPIALIPFTVIFTVLRFTGIVLGFAPFYLMMSSSYEVLFMVVYLMVLYAWMKIESRTRINQLNNADFIFNTYYSRLEGSHDDHSLTFDDIRRSFQYICFILVGFFGSGNIASVNFFDPMWTKCFVTVFSPFTMASLIILKIVVPFIYATCAFRAIVMTTRTNLQVTFSAILFISDFMLIHFLYNIKNVGSWLEIGTSISYFVVMESFILIILVLYGIAHILTTFFYVRFIIQLGFMFRPRE